MLKIQMLQIYPTLLLMSDNLNSVWVFISELQMIRWHFPQEFIRVNKMGSGYKDLDAVDRKYY